MRWLPILVAASPLVSAASAASPVYRIDHAADGDTVMMTNRQRVAYTPVLPTPPEWWADARIPLDDIQAPPEASS